jgi:hypothetical protein
MADEELKAEGVFVLSTPADMVAKLEWEIENYTSTMFHQMKQPEAFRSAGYQAFNCAVTAWHLADWIWAYADESIKRSLAERYHFKIKNRDRDNRNQFLEAVAAASRDIHICRYIANSSNHLKLDKVEDRGFRGQIGYGRFPSDDKGKAVEVFGFLIVDKGETILIERIFSRAFEYWKQLLVEIGYESRHVTTMNGGLRSR